LRELQAAASFIKSAFRSVATHLQDKQEKKESADLAQL